MFVELYSSSIFLFKFFSVLFGLRAIHWMNFPASSTTIENRIKNALMKKVLNKISVNFIQITTLSIEFNIRFTKKKKIQNDVDRREEND